MIHETPTPPTVLVTDRAWTDASAEQHLLSEAGVNVVVAEVGDREELSRLVVEADAILTCFKTVSADVIDAGPRLQVIGRYGVGVDNIDVSAATQRGIIVANVPAYCVDEVAEHVLAMVFAHYRGLFGLDRMTRTGAPMADITVASGASRRVSGRTIGVVGFGHIGQAVVARSVCLGMTVLVHDPRADSRRISAAGAEPVALDVLASRADVVTLHVPLVAATAKMIDHDFIGRMKKEAFLVNASRGGVVDLDALAAALHSGAIGGAGLDVTDPEPLSADHPLLSAPNTILTPHVAFSSRESLHDLQTIAARNVIDVLEGRRPASIVNPEVLELERWALFR